MPLSERDQVKLAVLADFADRGLSPDEARQELRAMTGRLKQASIPGLSQLGKVFDTGTDVVGHGLKKLIDTGYGWGVPLLLAGPFAAGGAGGYLAAQATDIDDDDVEAQKKRELIDMYNAQLARLRQR